MAESRDVARIPPPRLPYPDGANERFGVTLADWRALVDAIWPGALTVEAIILALSYCRARKLDPFKRPVHIVAIWSRSEKRMVESVWPGIGELRTTAFRTGLYAGREATEWGPDRELNFDGHTVIYPEWASITVHRLDRHGNPRAYPGPRVYWMESYATRSHDTLAPNEMWRRRARGQLDKCAEAAALRAAFPEEVGNDYSAEEMEGQVVDHAPATEEPAVKAPPLRGNEALRSRLQSEPPPEDETEEEEPPLDDPPPAANEVGMRAPLAYRPRRRRRKADEPTDTEIAAVIEQGDPKMEIIKPQRLPRDAGWDWPLYADELIAAALRTPIADLGRLRGVNASMFDVLRASDRAQWERVNTALADYEREGVSG